MKIKFLGIVVGLAAISMATPSAAAGVVTFEDQAAFKCDNSGSGASGGLSYSYGSFACYYSPSNPADFPTPVTSTVMANGYGPITFTLTEGGAFNVSTLDLAFGPFSHGGLTTDTVAVSGLQFGGNVLNTTLNIGFGFQTQALNWSNLNSLTFSSPQASSEYLAFDNIAYSVGSAVPEPGTWALMLIGFGAVGGAMRSRRRQKVTVSYA